MTGRDGRQNLGYMASLHKKAPFRLCMQAILEICGLATLWLDARTERIRAGRP